MSFRSKSIALMMCASALIPAAMWAQPATDGIVKQDAVPLKSRLDVPIEEIAASTDGRAVLDKDFPGLCDHSMYTFFKGMTLNQVAAMSRGKITPTMMAQARLDLSALSVKLVVPSVTRTDVQDIDFASRGLEVSSSDQQAK